MNVFRCSRCTNSKAWFSMQSKSAVVLNVAAGVTSRVTAMVFFLDASQAFTNSDPGQSDLDMVSFFLSC